MSSSSLMSSSELNGNPDINQEDNLEEEEEEEDDFVEEEVEELTEEEKNALLVGIPVTYLCML